jgi:hypothetical protein
MAPVKRRPDVFADIETRVEKIRQAPKRWQVLTEDDRLFILWAKSKGYGEPQIATAIGRSKPTVRNYFHKVQLNPLIIFDEKVYDVIGKKRYQCRFCHDQRETEMRIQRHVLAHFVPYEIARDMNLEGVRKPL